MNKLFYILSLTLLVTACSGKKHRDDIRSKLEKDGVTKEIVLTAKSIMESLYPFGDYPYSSSLFSLSYRFDDKVHTPVTNGTIYSDEINIGCCINLRSSKNKSKILLVGLTRMILIETNGLKHKIEERTFAQWKMKREEVKYNAGFSSITEVIDLDQTWNAAQPSDDVLVKLDPLF